MHSSLLRVLFFLLATGPGPSWSQNDPCNPNPCGENTRCSSSRTSGSPVISCECLIGFQVPEGGDPFDGCMEIKSSGGGSGGLSTRPTGEAGDNFVQQESASTTNLPTTIRAVITTTQAPSTTTTTPASTTTTEQPLDNRLQEGKRGSFLLPRRPQPEIDPIIRPNIIRDVDTPDLFPEECLVHEDCESTHFCSPPPANKCTDACTLDVCGSGAVCIAQLHRPVCACPDGFDGNPYDKCNKTPSRAGTQFKR